MSLLFHTEARRDGDTEGTENLTRRRGAAEKKWIAWPPAREGACPHAPQAKGFRKHKSPQRPPNHQTTKPENLTPPLRLPLSARRRSFSRPPVFQSLEPCFAKSSNDWNPVLDTLWIFNAEPQRPQRVFQRGGNGGGETRRDFGEQSSCFWAMPHPATPERG